MICRIEKDPATPPVVLKSSSMVSSPPPVMPSGPTPIRTRKRLPKLSQEATLSQQGAVPPASAPIENRDQVIPPSLLTAALVPEFEASKICSGLVGLTAIVGSATLLPALTLTLGPAIGKTASS